MSENDQVKALQQAILQRAQTLSDEHVEQGKLTRGRIIQDARAKVKLMEQKELLVARLQSEREYKRQVQASELRIQAELDRNRWGLVQSVLDKVNRELAMLHSREKDYRPLFENLLKQGVMQIGLHYLIAFINSEDMSRFADNWAGMVKKCCGDEVVIKLSPQASRCSGGVKLVSEAGDVMIDNTFEGIIGRRDEALQRLIFERLFSTVTGRELLSMGEVIEINGPIVTIREAGISNGEQVKIGRMGLIGEVIHIRENDALVQVYESTESLSPGETVIGLQHPLSVELGPGLLGQIFDGVQRPLNKIMQQSGEHITRGLQIDALDRDKIWQFVADENLVVGSELAGGQVLGTVKETDIIEHRILVPPGSSGTVIEHAPDGEYSIEDSLVRIKTASGGVEDLKMYHRWPVRKPRPYQSRANSILPLITGQRVLDTFFPFLKGGKAAVPGPFGAGKTMVQQQIARWANADIVLYVGCGERGNEIADILQSFPQLIDPHSGRSLMERTFLVANTSNMPVVAREASIYVGVTMAEYYRDQGYDVVMVADSTSRWAEALREVAGRLGQMPVEEGYPAYLASRLAAFYERAGTVNTLAGNHGSVSLIGAVSPPGGDFSEPVTSHTKEIIRTFWALSKPLADERHYPAVSWLESFTAYADRASEWWSEHVSKQWAQRRQQALSLLAEADELERIVNLVGPEALSSDQRWVLESAGLIKEAVLQQSALDPVDSYCSPHKQFQLLDLILQFHDGGVELISLGVPVEQLTELPFAGEFRRLKSTVPNDDLKELGSFSIKVRESFDIMRAEYSSGGETS